MLAVMIVGGVRFPQLAQLAGLADALVRRRVVTTIDVSEVAEQKKLALCQKS
jgi:hypothetical protein